MGIADMEYADVAVLCKIKDGNESSFKIIYFFKGTKASSAEEKDRFYEDLDREVQGRRSKTIVLGDLNGHVGKNQDGFEGVHCGHAFGKRNLEGDRILNFADSMDMVVVNTQER